MFRFGPLLCLENHESVSGEDTMNHTLQMAALSHFSSRNGISKARALVLALLAQLIAVGIARGQATTSIRGTVTDSSGGDRKSTRLNSSHSSISYAVFCLKKK